MTTYVSNFKKLPKEILLDVVNYENGSKLLPRQIVFGAPQPKTNKYVTVSMSGSEDYIVGVLTLTYRRVYLQDIYALEVWPTPLTIWDTTYQHVVDAFNRKYGINLTQDDVLINGKEITESFEQDEGATKPLVFAAKPTSLIWAGACTVQGYMSGEPYVDRPEGSSVLVTDKSEVRLTDTGAIRIVIL